MPAYPGVTGSFTQVNSNASPIQLSKGDQVYVWGKLAATATQLPVNDSNYAQETVVAPAASIAVDIQPFHGDPAPSVSVEIRFSAAPGAFSLQVQEADTDADGFYITPTNAAYTITAVNGTTFVARVDLSPTGGRFLRLYLASLTNAVNISAKISRLG